MPGTPSLQRGHNGAQILIVPFHYGAIVCLQRDLLATYPTLKFEQTGCDSVSFFPAGCQVVLTSMFCSSEIILGGYGSFLLKFSAIKNYWSIRTVRLKLLKCTSYHKVASITPYEPVALRNIVNTNPYSCH